MMLRFSIASPANNKGEELLSAKLPSQVDDVISQFKGSLDLWPTLIEICYYAKSKKPLPQIRVLNKTSNRSAQRISSKTRIVEPPPSAGFRKFHGERAAH
jgi:hypothetical protein